LEPERAQNDWTCCINWSKHDPFRHALERHQSEHENGRAIRSRSGKNLGLSVQSLGVHDLVDFDLLRRDPRRLLRDIDAADPFTRANRQRIVDFAARSRLPAIYETREFVEAGGLISYGPNLVAMQRRSATYIDKILNGAKPGDLPVEQPTAFELIINMKTANALGIKISDSILARADEVIQ
jgi:putative ABC transport system substrate-binding protein